MRDVGVDGASECSRRYMKTAKEPKVKKSNTKPVQEKVTTAPEALIKKTDNLADVIFKYPQVTDTLTDYGLHCVGCFASSFDTIEAGCKIHGMSDDEIAEMVARLNEIVEFGE